MSQLEGETKVIDGNTFRVMMLPPMRSHDLLMDTLRMVGPSLGPVIDGFMKSGGDLEAEVDAAFFTKAVSAFFSGLDKAVINRVIEAMRDVSYVDEKPLKAVFDAFFIGKLSTMYQWLIFAMKVQWGKSFAAMTGAVFNRGVVGAAE